MMKKKTNRFHTSISCGRDEDDNKHIEGLRKHFLEYRRKFNFDEQGMETLSKGVNGAVSWRLIGEKRRQEKHKYEVTADKKGRTDVANSIHKSLERIQNQLESLSVSDEAMIDNYVCLATKLHREPRQHDDNEQTLKDKTLLQHRHGRIINPHEFLALRNPVQGRGTFALVLKQMQLGIEYWLKQEKAMPQMRKSLDELSDIDILERHFIESQKYNVKKYAISPRFNTWFFRYCEYYFQSVFPSMGLDSLTQEQIKTAIQNYIDVNNEDSTYNPKQTKKRFREMYKKQ